MGLYYKAYYKAHSHCLLRLWKLTEKSIFFKSIFHKCLKLNVAPKAGKNKSLGVGGRCKKKNTEQPTQPEAAESYSETREVVVTTAPKKAGKRKGILASRPAKGKATAAAAARKKV